MTVRGGVIALLGAESTGKTHLAAALATSLAAQGCDAVAVPEYLREFCAREGRTPRVDEQAAIAAEQTRRIEAVAAHAFAIADTTALMIAIYSDLIFADRSLYPEAEAWQRIRCEATLVTALDLPWQADGLQRDGAHVREPVDAKLRESLDRAMIGYSIVSGSGQARLDAALAVVRRIIGAPQPDATPARWSAVCERCGDVGCERHLLARGR